MHAIDYGELDKSQKKQVRLSIWCLIFLFTILSGFPFLFEGCGILSLLSFAPLFHLESICRNLNVKHKGLYYFSAFLLFNIAATYWIWYVSPAGAIGALTVNAIFMTVIFRLFTFCRTVFLKMGKPESLVPYLAFILLWIGWEHVYFDIELSWPWLTLGNAFATSAKLVQWYEYTGVEGGSLWILISGIALYLAVNAVTTHNRKAFRRAASIWLALISVPAILSLVSYYSNEQKGEAVEVVAAQPNVDPFLKYGAIPQEKLDDRLLELFDSVITPDTKYLITPETFTYNIDLSNLCASSSFRKYAAYVNSHPGTSMLFGTLTVHPYGMIAEKPSLTARKTAIGWVDIYNSAMMIDCEGHCEWSHKSKLVPGVEIIPYQYALPFLSKVFDKFGGSTDSYGWTGKMVPLKGLDGHVAAPMICYESIYGDYSSRAVRAGADFLAVITNDGWWGDSPGYHQHFRFARLRAIENRRDLVHVANTGISGFINQRGDVISSTPYWVETAIRGTVNTNRELTFFSRNGDLTGRIAGVAGLILLAAIIVFYAWGRISSRGKSASGNS